MFPLILIQLENDPNVFVFFILSPDPNLLQKQLVKQKIKKLWPKILR